MSVKRLFIGMGVMIVLLSVVILMSYRMIASEKAENPSVDRSSSGILLGLRKDLDDRSCEYRTLWIASDENGMKYREIPFIFLISDNKAYTIEQKSMKGDSDYYEEAINYLVLNTSGTWHIIGETLENDDEIEEGSTFEVSRKSKVLFVSPSIIAINRISDYAIKREYLNAPTARTNTVNVYPLDSNGSSYSAISLKEVFGNSVETIIQEYKKKRVTAEEVMRASKGTVVNLDDWINPQDEESLEELIEVTDNVTNEFNWGIVRDKGQWIACIAKQWEESASYVYPYQLSTYQLYALNLPIPGKYIQNNDKAKPDWGSIKAAIPDAIDAVNFPNMMIVRTDENLLVWNQSDEGISKPDCRIKVDKHESIIMIEYSDGKTFKEWDEQVEIQ